MARALIEIKAETKQYQQAMKQAVAEMKKLTAEHSLAAAQAKLSGSAQDGLRAKVTELTSKIEVQKGIVQTQAKEYDNLKDQLVAQKEKHAELSKKVEEAKKAYEASTQAAEQNGEETEKLKAEYENLRGSLAQTETDIKNTENGLGRQETAVIKSKAALAELEVQLKETNAELARAPFDEYAKKAEKVGETVTNAGKALLPLSTGIIGIGTAAIKTTADFDSQMSKVSAISGATGEDFDKLREKAREMGARTKFSASESAEAFGYMAMAGWKTNDMLNGIEGVMNLAAASGEDLASVSDIVTDAMTAFGLSADGTTKIIKDGFTKEVSNASHFADVLAAASANSNTNVSMLGESFKYVAPVAGSLGYSVEDTAIALGLMASSGLKSSMAGSSLRTILTNLAKPTDAIADAMDYLGISLQNSDGSMKSLGELTNDLRGAFGQCKMPLDEFNSQLADIQAKYESGELTEKKYTEAVEDLTGKAYGAEGALKAKYAATIAGKEGMAGLLAIVSAAPADYEKLTQSIYDCDGSAESMAETMNDNLEGQITILLSQLQELAISFGDLLMPTIREIVKHVQDFVDKLNSMDEGQKQTILRIGLVVAALGPALVSIGKMIEATATVSKGLGTVAAAFSKAGGFASVFSKALGMISPPVVIAVIAIAGIVAAIVHLWNTNEDFRNKISEIWTKVKDSFVSMASNISEKLSGLSGAFSAAKELIGNIWDGLCNLLAPVILAAFNTIAIELQTAFDLISGLFDVFGNLVTLNWSGVWESIKGIFLTVWDAIKSHLSNILTAIGDTVNVFLGWFGTSWQQLWTNVKTACLEAWENVKTACSQALAKISSVCSKAWNDLVKGVTDFGTNLYNIIKNAFESAKEFVSNTWDTIKNLTQVALMAVGEIIGAAVQIITLPFQFIWQNCKDIVIQKWNEIKSAVQSALSYIKDNIVTPLMNGIKTITSTVLNAIKTTTTTVLSAIRGAVLAAFSYIRDNIVTPIMNAVKTAITVSWNAIKSIVTQTVTAVRNAIQTAFSYIRDNIVTPVSNAVRTTVTNAWNSIRTATTNAWNAVKNAVQNGINGAKSAASSAANAIKSSVSSVWNSIKSATSSTWNAIKNAITGPINAAKNAVGNAIAAIRAKFNFSWSLPHLKLPHPSISGKFSLNPPSVPHFSIAWYKNGGIMTQPTVFGAAGNTILAGGEAGAEAILPLKQFYDRLGEMLDKKIEAMQTKTTVIVYVTLDGEIIAEKVVTRVEDEMADEVRKRR